MSAATLLDAVKYDLKLRNDAELARELKVKPPVISKLRSNKLRVGATVILRIHEAAGMPVKKIRELVAQEKPFTA